jgi:hypothetical protein
LGYDLFRNIHYGTGIETEEVGDKGNHHPAHAQPAADADPAPVLYIAAGPLVA